MNYVTLNNGVKMPIIGLGTNTLRGLKIIRTVNYANKLGYQHFDTAWLYNNEKSMKYAFKLLKIKREDVFITSKLEWKQLINGASVKECYEGTLKRLGTDYIDLYLVHWPKPGYYLKMWEGLTELYKAGRIKAIGVSSFLEQHLERIKEVSDITPAVNQIELHPLNTRKSLVAYCKQENIQVEAHSPFARGSAADELMRNELILGLASKYNKSAAQIILRWIVQQGMVTIPRSVNESRLKENITIFDFELDEVDMNFIDSMNKDCFFGGDPRKTLSEI